MILDHDTGLMSGEILAGPETGKRLDALNLQQLLALLSFYNNEDADSAQLLEAYLDRQHGPEWREQFEAAAENTQDHGNMSREQALSILGFESDNPSREEIIERHRQLIFKLHPDRDGSTYLAAQVNRAKDVLLQATFCSIDLGCEVS